MEFGTRASGIVQWFSRVKGYGFIRPDGQEEDVFVHYSSIVGEGYRNLRRGQKVEFTMEDSEKGPQAVDVVEIATEEAFAGPSEADVSTGEEEEVGAAPVAGAADEGDSAEAYL
jgi:CspA family cold shock protein